MKVVHFECGLGNQILCFANYLLVKKYNPNEEVFMENLIYKIDRQGIGINQWNGFELNKIFRIELPNIESQITNIEELYKRMEEEHLANNGAYNSLSALNALNSIGLSVNLIGDSRYQMNRIKLPSVKKKLIDWFTTNSRNWLEYELKGILYRIIRANKKDNIGNIYKKDGNWFYTLNFSIMKNKNYLKKIDEELRKNLIFPDFEDDINLKMSNIIKTSNSIAIHVRRSDFLQYNNDCYKYGFFKKSVISIKKRVKDPVFVIFSDDAVWCRNNLELLGLNNELDKLYFVDWNNSENSFRDMQLMSMCKHNIITKSSFGWWAAYLNPNPDKIVYAQNSEYYVPSSEK